MNDKIMVDRYYCINSIKHCENEENIGALYLIISSLFLREYAMHDSGRKVKFGNFGFSVRKSKESGFFCNYCTL